MELGMAVLLLGSFYFLSREAAVASKTLVMTEETENTADMDTENSDDPDSDTVREDSDTTESLGKIVIDPGHGGMDPGMIGIDGLEEKGINLAISLKLKAYLENDGYSVVMTRETDDGLYEADAQNKKAQDMQNRILLITQEEPLLTVSIHQNSYEESSVCGPQVFYYADSTEGERLAEEIQACMNVIPGVARSREIKGNTSYYLLKRSPSVLTIVECGFLTNPDEAALLQSDDYQRLVAEAVRDGIENYLKTSTRNTANLLVY
jgi:N-acetylmuramoyl-L-alanine amidase